MLVTVPPLAAFEFTEPVDADFARPLEVFRSLFKQLPDAIHILPTENYAYFSFQDTAGARWRGNFCVSARQALSSGLQFYYERSLQRNVNSFLLINGSHGLTLRQQNPFCVELQWNGRVVELQLNRVRLMPPTKAILRSSEVYIGPSWDESGLQFCLLFDLAANCFLWVLNDDDPLPEEFSSLTSTLQRGLRTQYVFLLDMANNRRVLVGVADSEIKANSYYDGPFDQLPDNFIATGQVELRKYLELQNPDRLGQIDEFGFFKFMSDCRVAIAPYYAYQELTGFKTLTPEKFYGSVLKELNDF